MVSRLLIDRIKPELKRLGFVFLEKTRHGGFLGYGGDMPPFSEEVLPDSVLADIVQALLPSP